jgi:nitroreductase
MDVGLAVASKRDWRSYSDQPVPEDVRRRILDAGRLAGSAVNKQPWRFVVVESDDAKQRVSQVVYAEGNIQTCAFAVAIVTE